MNLRNLKKNKLLRLLLSPLIIVKRLYYKQPKDRFFELLFSNVSSGSLVVEIADIPAKFEIDVRSNLLRRILVTKKYEEQTANSIRNYINKDKDAINIGANVGIFSVLLAQSTGPHQRVLAVEPTDNAFSYLKKNVELNSVENKVILYNGICTSKEGSYSINTVVGREEYSSIGISPFLNNMNSVINKVEVVGETVDNLVARHALKPGLILIDVEGAEMDVIKGSLNTIKDYKPVIVMEVHGELLKYQNSSSKEVLTFLMELGYNIKRIEKRNIIKHPFTGQVLCYPI